MLVTDDGYGPSEELVRGAEEVGELVVVVIVEVVGIIVVEEDAEVVAGDVGIF